MMKKIIISLFLIFPIYFIQNANAQDIQQIAFVNSIHILDSLPEKIDAADQLLDLSNKYKSELKIIENDYKKKYSDFMSYQITMPENIRVRRMQELYELEVHIKEFMQIAQKDIDEQEAILINPLREQIKQAIYQIGVEYHYEIIYDLANPTIVFLTPDAVDATYLVKQKLAEQKKVSHTKAR